MAQSTCLARRGSRVRVPYSPPKKTIIDILRTKNTRERNCREKRANKRKQKGIRWMPWLWEAKKDVTSCDKPRVGANGL